MRCATLVTRYEVGLLYPFVLGCFRRRFAPALSATLTKMDPPLLGKTEPPAQTDNVGLPGKIDPLS